MNTETTPLSLKQLQQQVSLCLKRDQFKLRRALKRISSEQEQQDTLAKIQQRIKASIAKRETRSQALPKPEFPSQLPVVAKLDEIRDLIRDNQVVIVAGETGSGKTTQIPKICLSLGRGVAGSIGHTQPRRLAARSVANRLSEELKSELGQLVGYKVRFTDVVSDSTLIKIMTDGILLAEIQQDRFLENYDTIIIDEAHERSLNIDFLLGYLKRILPKRPDLKVIITSATIDHHRFSAFFNNAPVIEVSGRTFPVEVVYQPLMEEDDQAIDLNQGLIKAVNQIRSWDRENRGSAARDILAFFSGEREIREAATALRKHAAKGLEVLPLYARLSNAEQNRIFQSHGGQRIILATNVAETSLTVPNIGYVVDTGLARISRYSYRTKVQRLPIEPVSQASANQRMGRCGRIAEGICIRLYDEESFGARSEFTDPEILRTNLAAVILQLEILRLGEVEKFPFIDAPDRRLVNDGYRLLQELKALDQRKKITALGRKLARFPIDPRLAKMLLSSQTYGCVNELLIITSGLSVQDPRERPHEKAQQADECHKQWADKQSDFLAMVNLWNHVEEQRQELSNTQFNKYLKQQFISPLRFREWRDIHRQLRLLCKELEMTENQEPAAYDRVHHALLSGLLGNVGFKDTDREFLGARNRRFMVFPGSHLAKKPPKWLMAAEIVETSKVFARTVAKVEAEWVEQEASHLLKKSYSEPHWHRKRSDVMALEQASLYGLIIYEKRRVPYGPINRAEAREIFIRAGLVELDYRTQAPFYLHNEQLVRDIELLESKTRRKDLLVDDQVVYEFYEQRIPNDVFNGRSFESWRRKAEKQNPKLLFMQEEDLLLKPEAKSQKDQYPDTMEIAGITLNLEYHFDPATEQDGVVLLIPVGVLHQVDQGITSWLVPGFLKEKCVAMIKSLPKALRKNFVPIPDFVDAVLQRSLDHNQPIEDELCKHLEQMTGVKIPADIWDDVRWENHLFMSFKVLASDGAVIAEGRDLKLIKEQLSGRAAEVIKSAKTSDIEKQGLLTWDFGELPEVLDLNQEKQIVRAFPGLVDYQTSVSIELFESGHQAHAAHLRGLARLFALQLSQSARYIKKEFKKQKELPFLYLGTGDMDRFIDHYLMSIISEVFITDQPAVRSQGIFESRLTQQKDKLNRVASERQRLLAEIFAHYQKINQRITKEKRPVWKQVMEDVGSQFQRLFHEDFLWTTPPVWLRRYPAYLTAIENRLERLPANEMKSYREIQLLADLYDGYLEKCERYYDHEEKLAQLEEIRWMIEEFRISLYAQTVKTLMTVSEKRIRKKLSGI